MSYKNFRIEIKGRVACVVFDTGKLNVISREVLAELGEIERELRGRQDIDVVVLRGNQFGLGAGADIEALMSASRNGLAGMIDLGNAVFASISSSSIPWVALVEKVAMGGVLEMALACHAIIATKDAQLGTPEIKLNIFPGLGGTQRLPRRIGLVGPEGEDAAFAMVLQGKPYSGTKALKMGLIDAIVPDDVDPVACAEDFAIRHLPEIDRTPPEHLEDAEIFRELVMPVIMKATQGRENPRAPFVALDVMIEGANLPLEAAIKKERDAFLRVADSSEGRAGMRFFFTDNRARKLPKELKGLAREIKTVGVDGADGFMGNGILWSALQADYCVTGHVPVPDLVDKVVPGLRDKYAFMLSRGKIEPDEVDHLIGSVNVTTSVADLFDVDVMVEARSEVESIKGPFWVEMGAKRMKNMLSASNSSSWGPSVILKFFGEGGGKEADYCNLHFFGPAERMLLVEIVVGKNTSRETLATAIKFVLSLGKVPVVVQDGSVGFLVNACLGEYLPVAEELYTEGSSIESIDTAMRQIFPMGPFQVVDSSGIDVSGGLLDAIRASGNPITSPLIDGLRRQKRFGVKSGGGFYDYEDGKPTGVFPGLRKIAEPGRRQAPAEEIQERCLLALHRKARALVDDGLVESEAVCDLAFVYSLGFAMHLGGPIYYGQQQGWE